MKLGYNPWKCANIHCWLAALHPMDGPCLRSIPLWVYGDLMPSLCPQVCHQEPPVASNASGPSCYLPNLTYYSRCEHMCQNGVVTAMV